MKVVYLTLLATVAAAQLAFAQPQQAAPDEVPDARPQAIQHGDNPPEPSARSTNAENEEREQRRIARNQQRAAVLNQFLRKRNVTSSVVASVSALDYTTPFEGTIGYLGRVIKAGIRKLPFGGGSYFNGLHPHKIEFKNVDGERVIELADCILDFYVSRLKSDRIFIRSRSCSEKDSAYLADKRGFAFAGIVQIKNGQVVAYKDLSDTGLMISDDRLPHVFADPETFDNPAARGSDADDGTGS